GEKGPLWLEFTVRTPGAHGAYTHYSKSATKIAMRLAHDLEAVTLIQPKVSHNVRTALEQAHGTMEKAMGTGAAAAVSAVTLNVGTVRGGLKVNMVPSECVFETDIRLPLGVDKEQVLDIVAKLLEGYPEVTMHETQFSAPSWCDPNGEMVE